MGLFHRLRSRVLQKRHRLPTASAQGKGTDFDKPLAVPFAVTPRHGGGLLRTGRQDRNPPQSVGQVLHPPGSRSDARQNQQARQRLSQQNVEAARKPQLDENRQPPRKSPGCQILSILITLLDRKPWSKSTV